MKSFVILTFVLIACADRREPAADSQPGHARPVVALDTLQVKDTMAPAEPLEKPVYDGAHTIDAGATRPEDLLAFAKSLEGVPYLYASATPERGFDCSGFITYVFHHFNIAVPRSSVDFTNIQPEVSLHKARPGDLILFTGTDSTDPAVGHMGIINAVTPDGVSFIHATSGKDYGVTVTLLNDYYLGRFVKVIRVFGKEAG